MREYNGFKIAPEGRCNMYVIKVLGKGSTPKELKGLFTSYGAAQAAIDASNKLKGKTNGKADSTS